MASSSNTLPAATRRLRKEIELWEQKYSETEKEPFTAEPTFRYDENLYTWKCSIKGPTHSPYENGIFKIEIIFTNSYPFVPPVIIMKTPIYHPLYKCASNIVKVFQWDKQNINGTSSNDKYENWYPQLTVLKMLQQIRDLLDVDTLNDFFPSCQCSRIDPKHKDCLSAMKWRAYDGYNGIIHLQFKAERQKFIQAAKQWTLQHASSENNDNIQQSVNNDNNQNNEDHKEPVEVQDIISSNMNINDGSWNCSKCTFKNNAQYVVCSMCFQDKPSTQQNEENNKNENEVNIWLTNDINLPQYIDNFMNHGWDDMDTIINGLKEMDLSNMGVNKVGHQRKIMLWIKRN